MRASPTVPWDYVLPQGQREYNSDVASPRERARKTIVTLLILLYLLLLFEGAIRKWLFPQYNEVLYFIRDPIALWIYWLAIRHRLIRRDPVLKLFLLLAIVCVPVMFVQVLVNGANPVILLYGWRNFFYYGPLAFVIAESFEWQDIRRLCRFTLWIAIPMAILVYFQFESPPDSFINKNVLDDTFVFRVTGDIVRTTGTFSFTAGYAFYVVSVVCILVASWTVSRAFRPTSTAVLALATAAALTMIALSGSRTVFLLTAVGLLSTALAGFITKSGAVRFRAIIWPIALILLCTWVIVAVFPKAYDAMVVRQSDAVETEGSTLDRALSSFTAFTDVLPTTPMFGYGLGYGTGAGATLATGTAGFSLAEDEWSRDIMEAGPLIGVIYLMLRIALVIRLAHWSVRSARQDGNSLALILFGFAGVVILNGSITLQGTINGYGWYFAGLCMAAVPLSKPVPDRPPNAGVSYSHRLFESRHGSETRA